MKRNNLPKLIFRRSWLYDKTLLRKKNFIKPSEKVLEQHLLKTNREWAKLGTKILTEISRVTKLNWYEKEIVCYLTYGVTPYSDPLTFNIYSDIDTLTHELIHRILSEPENQKRLNRNREKLMRKYTKESQKTKTHIRIHAIHQVVLKNLFGEKRLSLEKKKFIHYKDYVRAWEIVEKDGSENIINELTRGLR
jgi:hypothetical protein